MTATRVKQEVVRKRANVSALNLILVILMLAMVASYIFLSNLLVYQKYILGVRKQQFNQINAGLLVVSSEINNARGIENLLLFAQASGMIEAKEISFILEEGGVALSNTPITELSPH